MSIPASFSCSLIHRPIVATEHALCGLLELRNKDAELDASRKDVVCSRYSSVHATGQMEEFCGQQSIICFCSGPAWCAFLGLPRTKEMFVSQMQMESNWIMAISDVLKREQRAKSVTVLRDSSRRKRFLFACASR